MARKSVARMMGRESSPAVEEKSHGSTESRPTNDSLARRTGEGRPSSLLDTRVVYCGDNLEQLAKLPDACADLIYIDPPAWPKPLRRGEGPPFNSNRNYEVFWGETKEKRV
jgi:hypothetical protein